MALLRKITCSLRNPTGLRNLVGCLKLKVSFAKEPYKKDYILQKRRIICTKRSCVSLHETVLRFLLWKVTGLYCGKWRERTKEREGTREGGKEREGGRERGARSAVYTLSCLYGVVTVSRID